MRFARRVADYRVHPPRCPHACRTATACVPQPTQCPRQQRASEPHTPQAVAGVGLHMARHMKAASCRLLRSHAAVDGTPRRLTVSHRAPRPAAALSRQQEANFLRNCRIVRGNQKKSKNRCAHCFAPSGGHVDSAALRRPARAHTPRPLASHMHHQSRSLPGRFSSRRRRSSGQTSRGAEPPGHQGDGQGRAGAGAGTGRS